MNNTKDMERTIDVHIFLKDVSVNGNSIQLRRAPGKNQDLHKDCMSLVGSWSIIFKDLHGSCRILLGSSRILHRSSNKDLAQVLKHLAQVL